MKLTLLAINTKFLHSSLSVWYLLGGLKQFALHSHDCLVVEATINQNLESIVERVVNSEPDLVGISTYIWNIRMLPELIEKLRQRLPKVTILLGGPEAGSNAEYWLNHRADFVLRGEGEYSIAALVDAIEEADGDALKLIPGLCYITDGNTHMNPVNTICNDYINPYGEEYFSNLKGSITYIESSRGCPFSCSYCLSSDQSVKYFPLDVIKQQIDKLSQSGCSTIKFVDRTFNCHPQRAKEIFEYVIGLDTECCFHFEVAADLFDVDLLSLLAAAPKGRIQLEIGLQSYNQKTLKAVRRFQDISRATENIEKLLSNQNIHIHLDLIAGLPFETLKSFKEGFNKAFKLKPHTLQLGFLKLLHSSQLRSEADSFGIEYSDTAPYEVNCTHHMSAEDINKLKAVENALRNTYNKGRLLETIDHTLQTSKFSPFELFYFIGDKIHYYAMPLEDYLREVYLLLMVLSTSDLHEIKDRVIRDTLRSSKGKCIPAHMRSHQDLRRIMSDIASKRLGHRIDYDHIELTSDGLGVYIDESKCDPVTGLYELYTIDLLAED